MRILVVTHYYPPEIGAPQARLSEMGREWVAAGHDVTVLTAFPNHPTGVIHPGYGGRARMRERVDGVDVLRTWVYATPNEGVLRKTLGHLSFMFTSVLLGLRKVGRPDVVIVSSPTFFSILSAWLIARIKRAKFVVEIRDLWPAFIVELGVLRDRRVIRLLEIIELASYKAADAVVTVTRGMRDAIVSRGIDGAKVYVVRNGVDIERFSGAGRDPAVRASLGARAGDLLVLYAGAHGISHALSSVADAASLLRDRPVHFAFVGEGAAKDALCRHVAELGLQNVTLKAGVPRDEMAAIIASSDVCLVPLRDIPVFAGAIPSKMFEFMASGKAVIGSLRGEGADILRDAGAAVVPPEDHQALARQIEDLSADRERISRMGRSAQLYVKEHFDRRRLAADHLAILMAVVGEPEEPSE